MRTFNGLIALFCCLIAGAAQAGLYEVAFSAAADNPDEPPASGLPVSVTGFYFIDGTTIAGTCNPNNSPSGPSLCGDSGTLAFTASGVGGSETYRYADGHTKTQPIAEGFLDVSAGPFGLCSGPWGQGGDCSNGVPDSNWLTPAQFQGSIDPWSRLFGGGLFGSGDANDFSGVYGDFSFDVTPVPEPAVQALLTCALVLAFARRRKAA